MRWRRASAASGIIDRMDAELEQRLARLEVHLAHVERQNEELNAVVVEQSRTITRLQAIVRQLSESVERSEIDRIRATNPRPPHSVV